MPQDQSRLRDAGGRVRVTARRHKVEQRALLVWALGSMLSGCLDFSGYSFDSGTEDAANRLDADAGAALASDAGTSADAMLAADAGQDAALAADAGQDAAQDARATEAAVSDAEAGQDASPDAQVGEDAMLDAAVDPMPDVFTGTL